MAQLCPICEVESGLLGQCNQCRQLVGCLACLYRLQKNQCPVCRHEPMQLIYCGQLIVLPISQNSQNSQLELAAKRLMTTLLNNVPHSIDLKNRMGWTSYIDFLQWNEIFYPVVKGIDCYGRPFVIVKLKVCCWANNVQAQYMMLTAFQRYADDKTQWQFCGHATPRLFDTSGGASREQLDLLNRLIEHSSEELISKEMRPTQDIWLSGKVRLLTMNEVNNTFFKKV